MRKILVLRGGALGDFIVTLPALAALRARWPTARIELAGNATAAALAVTRRLLDAAHSQHESRWAALYDATATVLPPDLATWLASFDLILNFWPDPDGDLAGRFPLHPEQRFLSSPALPTCAPAAAHYCEPLRALGLVPENFHYRLDAPEGGRSGDLLRPARLRLTDQSELGVSPSHPRRIALHPGSGSAAKNWPLPLWRELAEWLISAHAARLLIITGEAEPEGTRVALAPHGAAAHGLPLEDLITRLTSHDLFIGHDSGISHLAAACGVPSLLLFGPTDPTVWAPPVAHVQVLKMGASIAAVSLADVQTAVTAFLRD